MGVSGVADRTARSALGKGSILIGWIPLAVVLLLSLAFGEIPRSYQYLPLVASALLFGMPHGAVDYVAWPRAHSGRVDPRGVGAVSVLYLVAGVAYLALWFLAPVVAAVGFVVLTWFHWGQGDLYALRDLFGVDHVDDLTQQVMTVVVRGGLPMVVPLVAFPDAYRMVLQTFAAPFGGSVGSWWIFEAKPRLAIAGLFGTLTIVTLARGYARATDRRGWHVDAVDTSVLWVYFLFVPPVLAVGVYFCLWHSVRHIARVLLLDDRSVEDIAQWQWLRPLARFGLEAAVPTALALGFVGLLFLATPATVGSLAGATGLYLVGIAVLTLPHTVVVVGLDHEQRIWAV